MIPYFRSFAIILGVSIITFIILLIKNQERFNQTKTRLASYHNIENYFKIDNIQAPKDLVENIPDIYLKKLKLPSNINKTCAVFPKLFDLKFANDHWQTQNTSNGILHLLSAYLDTRPKNETVRIFGMLNSFNFNGTFFCQFWYENTPKPTIIQSEKTRWMWVSGWGGNSPNIFHPYLISCPIQNTSYYPMSVSVVEKYCDNATNNIRISYNDKRLQNKQNFTVSVKGLNFPYEDRTLRLVEWIELLFILGAEKITFYEFNIHPKTKRTLQYYVNRGKVKLIPITLMGGGSNNPFLQSKYLHEKIIQRRLQEVLIYNDCLYQNIPEFKYVSLLDTDEVIIPQDGTWTDLLEAVYQPEFTSYIAQNIYFLDSHSHDHGWFEDIPTYLHMLQHVYRATNYSKPGHYVKGFHDTSRVMLLHNHFPLACLSGCKHHNIDRNLAHLQHYRKDCVVDVKNCDSIRNNSKMDTRIWNFKENLLDNVLDVLSNLKYLDKTLENLANCDTVYQNLESD